VPSSTFSSESTTSALSEHAAPPERPVPAGAWGLTWTVVTLAALLSAVALERSLRARGYQPSVRDNVELWARERARISDGSRKSVAVLGASRIGLAWNSEAFAQTLPGFKVAQLAVEGSAPLGTLRDLAGDATFRGVAIVDIADWQFAPADWERQAPQIEAYHRRALAPGAMAESWLAAAAQSHLVLASAGGRHTLEAWLRRRSWPPAPYAVMHADRTRFANYSLTDVARLRAYRLSALKSEAAATEPAAWLHQALEVMPLVERIERRGGGVVFVRMPTCDEHWAATEHRYPKAIFWDAFARASGHTIHFKDYAELSSFACPDTSHIDSRDGPRFTRALLAILHERHLL
jgi:hypothetical protein